MYNNEESFINKVNRIYGEGISKYNNYIDSVIKSEISQNKNELKKQIEKDDELEL